jgi:hypothetical protein
MAQATLLQRALRCAAPPRTLALPVCGDMAAAA